MQDVKVKKNVKYLFHPFPKHWYTIEWVDFAPFPNFMQGHVVCCSSRYNMGT